MIIGFGLFEGPAWLLAKFYAFTNSYGMAITLIALVVMLVTAPLQLKSTKGMLEMQKLQPELRKLQQQHRGDRQKLNEEMMKLYQEHKVNPLASCFPLLLQFPVFIIMFRVLRNLTYGVVCTGATLAAACGGVADGRIAFEPKYVSPSTKLYQSLYGKSTMMSWGFDLSKTPLKMIGNSLADSVKYSLLVIVLGALYFLQQRMVAARIAVNPTMSPMQQKLMQYLPVLFAGFLVFQLTGLVIYYIAQAIFRIGLQYYITRRFYHGEASLGQQAMAAGAKARELAKDDPAGGGAGGGMFGQMKKDAAAAKQAQLEAKSGKSGSTGPGTSVSKRVTPPKNKPTPGANAPRPPSTGKSARPQKPSNPPKK